jgi:hypothetical protein
VINHVSTLLLNQPPDRFGDFASTPQPPPIDPSFRPIPLSGVDRRLHAVLFGAEPDDVMLTWRIWQILPVLWGDSFFREILEGLDARRTYDPFRSGMDFRLLDLGDPFRVSGSAVAAGSVLVDQDPPSPDDSGTTVWRWRLVRELGGFRVSSASFASEDSPWIEEGSSALLPGRSGLRFSVDRLDAVEEGGVLELRVGIRPRKNVADMIRAFDLLDEEAKSTLILEAPDWAGRKSASLEGLVRLGCWLTAFVLRLERLRRG